MSHAVAKAYSQCSINIWTGLSLAVTVVLWGMYVFGTPLLHFFNWVWDALRYICYALGII